MANKSSQAYREERKGLFRSNGNGTFGGYKTGVVNGPDVRTERGKRRIARKKTGN